MPPPVQNYSCANLRNASFVGQSLPNTDFSCANLFGVDFSNADLVGSNFSGANLAHSSFLNADVTGADFSGANTFNAKFGQSPGSVPAPPPGVTETIIDGRWEKYPIGPFLYQNNMEGLGHLPAGQVGKQSLRKRTVDTQVQYGWLWDWPDEYYPNVWAYPELIFGWKPWDKPKTPPAERTRSNTAKLPKLIADVSACVLTYDVELNVSAGSYDLAPEIWITDHDDNLDSSMIRTEVMFWLDFGSSNPANRPIPAGADKGVVDTVTIGGYDYELFFKDDMKSESPPARWKILTYRIKKKPALRGVLPIHEFILDGIERGLIDKKHFLASVEFGNEVFSGRGELWIRNISIDIS